MSAPEQSSSIWLAPADQRLPEATRHLQRPCTGLWFSGAVEVLHQGIRIGIVGSRLPRADSARFAKTIAAECARAGMTVVSGLAVGIDGIAHRAALDAGGDTIAVLAGGLGAIYPARHGSLAAEIAGNRAGLGVRAGRFADARGAIVTEYGPGANRCQTWQFQMRNRIIAALSDYVVVIQAKPNSGSIGTALAALDVGVPVGVVPSAPDDECYVGSIGLLRDGADSVVDVVSLAGRLELHGIMQRGFRIAVREGATIDPHERGAWVAASRSQLDLLDDAPSAALIELLVVPRVLDELAELARLDLTTTRRALMELERMGRVIHRPDGGWSAC
ncbi:MAG: DNA-processing protein DprA [Thermoleophilia bacterium]|nr:DNA-processing protein DprA [Thermoleophilia bacterium]